MEAEEWCDYITTTSTSVGWSVNPEKYEGHGLRIASLLGLIDN